MMRYFYFLCLLGLFACGSTLELPKDLGSREIDRNFALAFNTNMDSLWKQYHPEAVLIGPAGEIHASEEDRRTQLAIRQKDWKSIKNIETQVSKIAGYRENFRYEIGSFQNEFQVKYSFVLVSELVGNQYLRKLEMIVPFEKDLPESKVLDPFREKWIQLCNQHNAEELVNQLYTNNTLYYNHKPMVIGREAVTKVYAYMNRTNYQLNLEPIWVSPVQEGLIFEIGQCSGSYNDKYILVWQLQEDGSWQVLMDSNI